MLRIAILLIILAAPLLRAQWDHSRCWIEDAASDQRKVYLLCEEARVYISDDRGEAWREVSVPTEAKLSAIYTTGSGHLFVIGDKGTLLSSGDEGKTWETVPVPSEESLRDIEFVGEQGWIVGHYGTILHSADGGKTWLAQGANTTSSLESVSFVDPMHGLAVGWSGAILRTANGGATWDAVRSPDAKWTLNQVVLRDQNNGWAVGFLGQILRTRDGGLTWEAQNSPAEKSLYSIFFDESGKGWIAGEDSILVSQDGGETWRVQDLKGWVFLRKVIAVGDSLWAVGPFGIWEKNAKETSWQELDLMDAST